MPRRIDIRISEGGIKALGTGHPRPPSVGATIPDSFYGRWMEDASALLDLPTARIERALELVDAVVTLLDMDAGEAARTESSQWLAHTLPPRLGFEGDRLALRREGYSATDVHRLLGGYLVVMANAAHQPQTVQIGKPWVKDSVGKQRRVTPFTDLSLGDLLRWMVQRAYKLLRESLNPEVSADRKRQRRADDSAAKKRARRESNATQAKALLNAPEADRFTTRQRQILELLGNGATVKEVAKALRITENTVRVQRARAQLLVNEKRPLWSSPDTRGTSRRQKDGDNAGHSSQVKAARRKR